MLELEPILIYCTATCCKGLVPQTVDLQGLSSYLRMHFKEKLPLGREILHLSQCLCLQPPSWPS